MSKRGKEKEVETPKMKARPIVRLGILLISHSLFVSVACCISGILALLLLPVLAKNTYISENALMPGSASPMLSNLDVADGNRLAKGLTSLNMKPSDAGMGSRRLIAQYMLDLGAEVSYHRFHPQPNQFHPLQFFSSHDTGIVRANLSCQSYGINTVGIIRAPRGDGREAIVLVTPYNSLKNGFHDSLSIGIAYSVFSLLSRVTWLAKDIIWLVADSHYEDYAPVAAWLRDYHSPKFSMRTFSNERCHDVNNLYDLGGNRISGNRISDGFRRAGTMAAALVMRVSETREFEDTVSIYAEASNGQMPNLDLINIVNYLAVQRQGLRVKVKKFWSLLDSSWFRVLGEIFEFLGKTVRNLNPGWKFGIPAADYVEGAATLASSMYYQALGVPTGPHGAFRDFQIDAITLEISPSFSSDSKVIRSDFLLKGGRLIEGVTRSVNNLLEKFHQSFFLYLLTSPSKFVSVGVYMIAFALIIAPLPIVAASLYIDANNLSLEGDTSTYMATAAGEHSGSVKSWIWLNSARTVFVIHLWGAVVSLAPYFIYSIQNWTPTGKFMMWVLLSAMSLLILYFVIPASCNSILSQREEKEWALLKSMTIAAVFIGLCLMSIINFATAEIGALLLVPMCLMVRPLKLDLKVGSLRNISRAICNLIFVLVSFPPATFLLLKGVFEGFDSSISVGDFWNWVESLWAWNSATYLYIGMVHLPCWVLCVQIVFHAC